MAFEVVFDEKVKKLGFELGLEEDDRPHVSGVKPGGAAIALGVRAGDILVTINGAPVGKPSREEIKALLKVRPLTLQLERISSGGAAGAEVSDSGSESDGQVRSSPKEARLNADMALLCAAKAKSSSSACGKVPKPAQSGYATEQPPAAQATTAAASGHDSGEDSAEESHGAEPSVTAERFDRDMDLLHKKMKPVLQAQAPEAQATQAAISATPHLQVEEAAMQADIRANVEDDAAIAAELQREEEETAGLAPGTAATRPDLLAAASAVAAAREEERRAEEDDDESWAEEEIQRGSTSKGGLMQIKVRVPDGCGEGDTLEVVAPSGDLIHVLVPPGHGPGSLLLVQVQQRSEGGPENLLYQSLVERHTLEQWEAQLEKLVSGYSVMKVARNGKLYNRSFWLAGGSLRTNGRFNSGIDLRHLTGVFCGAVSQEFIKLRRQEREPPKKSGSLAGGLLRTFVASKPMTQEHPDPEEAGVVIIATGGRSFSLLFLGGAAERDEFAETITWCVQRVRREMGRPFKF